MSVNEEMTALAEAIRDKANASGKMSIRKMTVTVRGISVGEGDATVQTEKQVLISSPSGVIAPDSGYDSMSSVAYDLDVNSKANLKAENIKPGVKILGVTGGYVPPMESALVNSIEPTLIYPTEGKAGFNVVDVAIPRETVSATPTKEAQSFTPRNEGGAIVKVNVAPIPDNYIDPVGTKEILANGTDIDVRSYNAVTVRVPENTGEVCQHQEVLTITSPDNKAYYPGERMPGHYYDAISKVEVEIPRDTKAVTPSKDEQIVTPEVGTMLSQVIVNPIPSVYVVPSGRLEITQPNTIRNCEKYAEVSVHVPIKDNKIITANGVYDAADEGYAGFASVEIDVPAPAIMNETKVITANGLYDALDDNVAGYSNVRVNIPNDINLQGKTAYANGLVYPDEGYDGLEYVDVVIPSQVKTIKANGTYEADEDGNFSKVIVDVPTGGGEDISAELATQANLISQIKTALAGKAAGGNSIIVGEWLLNNVLTAPPEMSFSVNFKDGDGSAYSRINTIVTDDSWSMYYGGGTMAASDGSVEDPPYATLDFGDTPQTVPSDFGAWLMTNATYKAESGGGADNSTLIGLIEGDVTELVIPDGVTKIRDYAFNNLTTATKIEIPDSVAHIGERAFMGCSKMKSITLPQGITEIKGYTFFASGLTGITIPEGVTAIQQNAFANCSSLASVELPSTMRTIANYAFSCNALKSITCHATTPPTHGGDYVFNTVPADCAIYVPAASVEAYKAAAYWSRRAAYIQAIS